MSDYRAFELEHQAQNAMHGRVLRPEVDHDALVMTVIADCLPVAPADRVDLALGRDPLGRSVSVVIEDRL